MKRVLLGLLCVGTLMVSIDGFAQKAEKPQFVAAVEGIKEYRLSNGLQVLLIPDPSQSNMVVNIIYQVGSKHEGYGEKGMAHLLEHMLFKSTKNMGDIKKMLSDKGGNANGTTYYDRTNYYEIFPYSEENLKWSIEMEADRMLNATLIQSDLDKEFSVVRNEFEIGENYPSSVLMEKVVSAGYLWHNYGNSTIGSKEDVERVKASQLRKFYEKYYQPDNATLIVAGKFEEDKALKYIEQYFSVIPKPARVLEEILTVEPAQDGEKLVELKRAGDSQFVGAMYHTASYADSDYATLDVLSEILTNNPSGYLYKALVETHKASAIYAYQPEVRDASFVYFGLQVPMDKDIQQVKNDLRLELDKVSKIDFTDQDVERAKAKLIKQLEDNKNNTISYAISLTEIVGAGDYRLGLLYRDYIEKMTKEEVKRVAENYFRTNNRTVGVFIPSKDEKRTKAKEFLKSDIAALTTNYVGKEQEADAAPFESSIANVKAHYNEGKLSNGFKYATLEKQLKGNQINASFMLPMGNSKALENKGMVAGMMASLLNAGTTSQTKEQIKDRLNILKSSVYFQFSGQNLQVYVSSYNNTFTETMEIVGQLLTESVFPESELVKTKSSYKTFYEGILNDPQSLAFREIGRMTNPYPKTSIFYTPSIPEAIEQVEAVTRSQIVEFYKTILDASQGAGTVIGLADASTLPVLLDKVFKGLHSQIKYEKIHPTFFATSKIDKDWVTVDKENATATGRISFKMDTKSADYPALMMANEILGSGGFLGARIPKRLREKEGISYGAGSYVSVPQDNDVAMWGWYAFFNPTKKKAVENALKEEVALAVKDGFTETELKENINSWKVSRKTDLGNDDMLLQLSQDYLLKGALLDDYDQLEQKVEKLSLKEVNSALKKYVKPEQLTTIYVGDFTKK
ncbi:pitrilysin family protein [Flavobacterium sp. HSC-61S13]|uniref:M16 family metallopeptidase n=1 Tax=Flavobacterium sp. HSC-61S13 TaxID=2910963 RepID=UPI00209CE57E|nr:M16 family metallopeptidase [Flavobacterium sp. HSC-61S13]MCP1997181.1 zinc protease [Flavobacterium sp. HSC-61S13]